MTWSCKSCPNPQRPHVPPVSAGLDPSLQTPATFRWDLFLEGRWDDFTCSPKITAEITSCVSTGCSSCSLNPVWSHVLVLSQVNLSFPSPAFYQLSVTFANLMLTPTCRPVWEPLQQQKDVKYVRGATPLLADVTLLQVGTAVLFWAWLLASGVIQSMPSWLVLFAVYPWMYRQRSLDYFDTEEVSTSSGASYYFIISTLISVY